MKENFNQSVDFVYPEEKEIDEAEFEVDQESKLIVEGILNFCFEDRQGMGVAFRRFVALCYVARPEVLNNATIRNLADQFSVCPQSVNRFVQDAKRLLKIGKTKKSFCNQSKKKKVEKQF